MTETRPGRFGVTFTNRQHRKIARLRRRGRTLAAQRYILKLMEKRR